MESYETILHRMESAYEEEAGFRPEDVSESWLRLRVLAGELYRLQARTEWLARQAFPHTASGRWLDRHGEMRGVKRRPAVPARGSLTFSRYLPLSFDMVIPRGTVCAIPGETSVEYVTLEEGLIAEGELSVSVPAQAVAAGAGGNAAAGHVNSIPSAIIGVDYVTNPAPFTGGRDEEEDEPYRARLLNAYASLPNGSNAAYYRELALAHEGITAAGVRPRVNGAGTVGVYVWGEGAAPAQKIMDDLAEELNARRELGVTVTVAAASTRSVNVSAQLRLQQGAEFPRARERVEAALRNYFAGLEPGSPVFRTEVEKTILNAAPVAELFLAANLHDFAGDAAVLPVAGTITVEEME